MASNSLEMLPSAGNGSILLSGDPRWLLAQRIAASDIFSKSEFLQKFLLHICELHLQDRDEEIREQNIGVRVFGRAPSYNPGDDNIVRNYAVQLRKRLNLYFEREGSQESFRLEIPRGAYIPVFHARPSLAGPQPALAASAEETTPISPAPGSHPQVPPARKDWRMFLIGLLFASLLWGTCWLAYTSASSPPAPKVASRPLWATLFSRGHDTLIVPADAGVGILQNLSQQPASLTSYSNGEYLSSVRVKNADQGSIDDLRTQRYTSMVDLDITTRLSHLPEVIPDHLIIRYARDLRIDDLRGNNVILLGAIHTDPWINLLQANLNFKFVCDRRVNDCYILNTHPAPGERPLYRSNLKSPYRETYSVVALLPNLDHTGWILLIEGLDMAGTEAAANILMNDSAMRPVIQKAFTRNGKPRAFELLIQTGSLEAEALPAGIVAERFSQ
ncbi:hypothetical protein [Acidobacterium capsulatum]|uniref:hypothetical protein n=1 Tax=Acidobacterium capsulatum TaxID=33075 RepID=UPI00068C77E5|nr:hypothetical protein [Acidobacterium capsulatum]